MFGEGGISYTGDLLDTAVQYNVIGKSGNTYSFGEAKLGVGRENAKIFLKDNPKVAKQLEDAIWRMVKEGKKQIPKEVGEVEADED